MPVLALDPAAHEATAPAIPRAARQRLPATVRTTQILDAALAVFSERGFSATRIDDIAAAAGLSKGGIYTHFRSKDEIFEALLSRSLAPPEDASSAPQRGEAVTVDLLIAQFIEPMYASLADPLMLRTLRLLLADGARVPERVARWRASVVEPHRTKVERLVRRGVQQGLLRRGALSQAPWLLMSPGIHLMLERLVQDEATAAGLAELAACKRAHIAMLRELLTP
ncbi:MAG: helix-turn-helix domain-containing protein [Pseudorhodoferax sp.]